MLHRLLAGVAVLFLLLVLPITGPAWAEDGSGAFLALFPGCSFAYLVETGSGLLSVVICRDTYTYIHFLRISGSSLNDIASLRVVSNFVVYTSYAGAAVPSSNGGYLVLYLGNNSLDAFLVGDEIEYPRPLLSHNDDALVAKMGTRGLVLGRVANNSLVARVIRLGVELDRLGAATYSRGTVLFVASSGLYSLDAKSLLLRGYKLAKPYRTVVSASCSSPSFVAALTDKPSLIFINASGVYETLLPRIRYSYPACSRHGVTLVGYMGKGIVVTFIETHRGGSMDIIIRDIAKEMNILSALMVPRRGLYIAGLILLHHGAMPAPFIAFIPAKYLDNGAQYRAYLYDKNEGEKLLFTLTTSTGKPLTINQRSMNIEEREAADSIKLRVEKLGHRAIEAKKPTIITYHVELVASTSKTTSIGGTTTKTTITTTPRTSPTKQSTTPTKTTIQHPPVTGQKSTSSTIMARPVTKKSKTITSSYTIIEKPTKRTTRGEIAASITLMALSILLGALYGRHIAQQR